MKILLDTHALLWAIADKQKLGKDALINFLSKENALYFSIASLWEISIKISLGKLRLTSDWSEIIAREMAFNTILLLPINMQHCVTLEHLPFHHRDPFDRMLIAQALVEGLHIMTKDSQFRTYDAPCCW